MYEIAIRHLKKMHHIPKQANSQKYIFLHQISRCPYHKHARTITQSIFHCQVHLTKLVKICNPMYVQAIREFGVQTNSNKWTMALFFIVLVLPRKIFVLVHYLRITFLKSSRVIQISEGRKLSLDTTTMHYFIFPSFIHVATSSQFLSM